MYVVGITGASGAILGVKLIEKLLFLGEEVAVVVSNGGKATIELELMNKKSYESLEKLLLIRGEDFDKNLLKEYADDDFYSPIASGSGLWKGIAVVPSSMKTVSSVANGYGDNLITRGCDVALKEGRACVIVPRETPFSLIHLDNMRKIVMAGGKIVPPIPAFYQNAKTIDEMLDYIIEKVLTQLGVDYIPLNSWGG